jgi:hypothetical protein
MTERLGISGRIARLFLDSELTPLLGITALLLGLFAVAVTPREEEPQINVTMANVIVPFPGADAARVESLVATPMEKVLAEISGVKHIYSVSRPGAAVVTVQFEVGEERTDAIVRLYNAIYSNQDWRPPGVGILQPLVKPKGIDDVPVLSLTLWTKDPERGAHELRQVPTRSRPRSSASRALATSTPSAAPTRRCTSRSTRSASRATASRSANWPAPCRLRTSCCRRVARWPAGGASRCRRAISSPTGTRWRASWSPCTRAVPCTSRTSPRYAPARTSPSST